MLLYWCVLSCVLVHAPMHHFLSGQVYVFVTTALMCVPPRAMASLGAFVVGLPAALSFFPQKGRILASELEPEFQGLTAQDGSSVSELCYNKGL